MSKLLNAKDLNSETWQKLKEDREKHLTDLRSQNDADLDPIRTANLRGQIKEVKKLLGEEVPLPEFKDTGAKY